MTSQRITKTVTNYPQVHKSLCTSFNGNLIRGVGLMAMLQEYVYGHLHDGWWAKVVN